LSAAFIAEVSESRRMTGEPDNGSGTTGGFLRQIEPQKRPKIYHKQITSLTNISK
jgi:hypothetical protein